MCVNFALAESIVQLAPTSNPLEKNQKRLKGISYHPIFHGFFSTFGIWILTYSPDQSDVGTVRHLVLSMISLPPSLALLPWLKPWLLGEMERGKVTKINLLLVNFFGRIVQCVIHENLRLPIDLKCLSCPSSNNIYLFRHKCL